MTSRPPQNRTPVYAAILLLLFNFLHTETTFANASQQDHSQAKVYDFKVYREVIKSTGRLLIERKSAKGKRVITYSKGESRLTLVLDGKNRRIHFSKSLGNRNYHFYAKAESPKTIKFGVIPEYKLVQFDSSCEKDERQIKSLLARLSIPELADKMSAIGTENLIDNTCRLSEKSKTKFAYYISDALNPQTSFLSKCLNSDIARSEIINNDSLRTSTVEIFGAYLARTEDIANGKGNLKFSCIEMQETNNVPNAVFDPNSNSIKFPIKDGKIVENQCEDIERTIAHELCHPTAKDSVVHELDRICLKAVEPDKIDMKCNAVAAKEKDHIMNASALEQANKAIDKAQLTKVQPELQKTVKAEDFKPLDKVTDTAVEQIANPSSPQSFQANTQQVFESMDSTFDSLSESLTTAVARSGNIAIGAAVPIASAAAMASSSGSKRNIASTSSLPSNMPSSEQEYKAEEILADQYQVPVNQVETILKKNADAQPAAVAAKKTATVAKKNTNDDSSSAAAVSASSKVKASPSANIDMNSDGASSSSASAAASAASPSRKPSSINNTNEVATVALQELEQYSEVRGNRYSEIRKLYQDPKFRQELVNRGITIKVGSKYFPKAPTASSVIFVDNGSTLKKVAGTK